MKYVITEKQLVELIAKQQVSDDLEYEKVSDANPSKDDFVIGQEVGEQDEPSISTAGASSTSSSSDIGTSPGAADYPPYPEVKRWGQDGQTPKRGAANAIATQDKWGDHNQHPPAQAANSSF